MCRVRCRLYHYLCATDSALVGALWIDLLSLAHCSKAHLSQYTSGHQGVLLSRQPQVYLHVRDVRKYVTLSMVFAQMPWTDI